MGIKTRIIKNNGKAFSLSSDRFFPIHNISNHFIKYGILARETNLWELGIGRSFLELDTGCMLEPREIIEKLRSYLLQQLSRIFVFHVTRSNMKSIVRTEVFIIFVLWHLILNFKSKGNSGLPQRYQINYKAITQIEHYKITIGSIKKLTMTRVYTSWIG